MDEKSWSNKWLENIDHLRDCVLQKNKILDKLHSNSRIVTSFIDATNLDWLAKLSQKHERIFLITEQTLKPSADNVVIVPVPHNFYGLYLYDFPDIQIPIQKDFNCFIGRNDPIRQSWFYFFISQGLLDRGYVSFNNEMRPRLEYPTSTPDEYFDWIHETYLSSFDDLKSEIKQKIPFKNFIDTGDLSPIILSSKFSIIIETYFERVDCQVFSEKTFRALHFPRPFLLFAATGCVQRLRDLGFDVFDDYVNHDYDFYDTSEICVERQDSILDQCKKLIELEVTPDILRDWEKRGQYNRDLLKKWNKEYLKDFNLLLEETFKLAKP